MRRRHLFEFEDLGSCPKSIRVYVTDFLRFFLDRFKTYERVLTVLEPLAQTCHQSYIVDMCSGSGGPIKSLLKRLHTDGITHIDRVVLTDKFPKDVSVEEFDILQEHRPEASLRTMFSAFHHFRPPQARRILENAASDQSTILIAEFNERSIRGLLFMLVGLPLTILCAPFIKPFRWSRIFWTYLIPIGPMILLWDGIASSMRSYTAKELINLAGNIEHYYWESGYLAISPLQKITYLVGMPIERQNNHRLSYQEKPGMTS